MARLDEQRQKELQPLRLKTCKAKLIHLGFEIKVETETMICFEFKGHDVVLYPYSGWHTGKSIKDGRGFKNLLSQLK